MSLIAGTSNRLWYCEFEVERCGAICGRRRNGAVAPACGRRGDLVLYSYIGKEMSDFDETGHTRLSLRVTNVRRALEPRWSSGQVAGRRACRKCARRMRDVILLQSEDIVW